MRVLLAGLVKIGILNGMGPSDEKTKSSASQLLVGIQ